jgi:hypothetical protein
MYGYTLPLVILTGLLNTGAESRPRPAPEPAAATVSTAAGASGHRHGKVKLTSEMVR